MTKIICFDLRCLQIGHESRGIGMHARSMLENIDPTKDVEYIIYAYDKNDPIKKLDINIPVAYQLVQTKTVKKSIDSPKDFYYLSQIIWHRFRPLQDKPIDAFIQFDFMLGFPKTKNIKKILIAYDLIPLIFKDQYMPTPLSEFKKYRGVLQKSKKTVRALYYQMRYSLHYKNFFGADLILSISKDTARSLTTILGIPSSKIVTIPLAPVFSTCVAKKPNQLNVKNPFIFYIGATDPRKRVQDLIEAFAILRDKKLPIDLVLVGKEFAEPKKIPQLSIRDALENSPYKKDIYTLGYVTDEEKLWLYKNALVFVFPTVYEGFGLPVLEAMKSGCPVISYNNSSIPEVANDAAILIKTGDISAIVNSVKDLCSNEEKALRSSLIRKGVVRSRAFTWTRYMNTFYSQIDQLT